MPESVTRHQAGATAAGRDDRVQVECDPSAAPLRHVFQEPLTRQLALRSGGYHVRLQQGRQPGEIMGVISARGRQQPLCLYFPDAKTLSAQEVERIVRSVLEGMGPLFR
jgi:hypothetical protein